MFEHEFYPTPRHIAEKLLNDVDFTLVSTILEPSAGKGDLLDYVLSRKDRLGRNKEYDIDCIEIDTDLRATLKGKGYRVIANDFLKLKNHKIYSLIVMNPPFSNGDKHLLKAIEIAEESGGKIRCILNAETLKNPYSDIRKHLQRKLNEYNATVEYVQNGFSYAERKTDVEIAIIKLDIPRKPIKASLILDKLEQDKLEVEQEMELATIETGIEARNFLKAIVKRHDLEVNCAMRFLKEYQALCDNSLVDKSFDGKYNSCIFDVSVTGTDRFSRGYLKNDTIKAIRSKYWSALFNSQEVSSLLTQELRNQFHSQINDMANYPFTLSNIYELLSQLNMSMSKNLEDCIIKLFDKYTYQSYYDDYSQNIHYFNGWRTNKAYIVNKKVVVRLNAYSWYNKTYSPFGKSDVKYEVEDMEKVFNYLDTGRTQFDKSVMEVLKEAQESGQTKNVEFKYFYITFYKKGTAHVVFKDMELLKKFNLFGCQKKGWLPPNYGKKSYKDMTKEEKAVIDDFEGEKEYNKTLADKEYYLPTTTNLIALGVGK